MGKLLFARRPSEKEEKILYEIIKEGEEYLKKRAKAIILSGIHRYRISEISKLLHFHPQNLRKWIHRFNRWGPSSIIESPKAGKRKKFDIHVKKKIVEIVKQSPRKMGLLFSYWTLHGIKNYLEKNKIVPKISHETIRRILREANINLKKLRKVFSAEIE